MMHIELPKIYPVTSHTDNVGAGTTFVAIPGTKDDGSRYISTALEKGAVKIVVQQDVQLSGDTLALITQAGADLVYVENCRKTLAQLIAQALDYPAKKLKIIGVTGTKGKTSTSYMIHHLLTQQGKKAALISTAEKIIGSTLVAMDLTTPLPEHLHIFFDLCVKHGVEYVVMEVSAQSLTLHRVHDLEFEAGIFTNFSLEHLEFYKNMQEYLDAKLIFLNMVKQPQNMFINFDDPSGRLICQKHPEFSSYSLEDKKSSWYGWAALQTGSLTLQIKENDEIYNLEASLVGKFNAYNLFAAALAVHSCGFSFHAIAVALLSLRQIPGRMEQYPLKNGATCFIDYAHNPSSYEAVLSTLRQMTSDLMVVFGAGGARDKSKRPMMGAIVEKYCDFAIVTSDNPRNESAGAIADDIMAGFTGRQDFKFMRELNRTKAIELAYELSKPGTVIAVLGKGRDEYQIVGHLTFPFKERAIIRPFLREDNLYKSL
ncbi:UDP-N-acetylmuramoyl-L-alanyl-D-glutamate--2,6-diaminopimelate ligase [Candidatus Babeliales bacterium]|nr:UDP-N-acetylmuramoyl-L-alanyl-D-glutamate--2,6-diaminopimelate ligase [Candidatus Babeliales bacterium]MBP9844308.1 UDP-N-acetylmuramoyl-L-alanyl-D-glutamate--2,6-diaminopimelate ligase [Candidatus Babeliales bacterium]